MQHIFAIGLAKNGAVVCPVVQITKSRVLFHYDNNNRCVNMEDITAVHSGLFPAAVETGLFVHVL